MEAVTASPHGLAAPLLPVPDTSLIEGADVLAFDTCRVGILFPEEYDTLSPARIWQQVGMEVSCRADLGRRE